MNISIMFDLRPRILPDGQVKSLRIRSAYLYEKRNESGGSGNGVWGPGVRM